MQFNHTLIFNEMGFFSFKEFMWTAFGLQFKKVLTIMAACFTIVQLCLTWWVAKMEAWIFSPALLLIVVIAAIVFDWLCAVIPAIKAKKYQSDKAKRVVGIIVFHTVLLSLLFWAEKANADGAMAKVMELVRIGVANYIICNSILSAVANAGRNGLMSAKVVKFITDYVDTHKPKL